MKQSRHAISMLIEKYRAVIQKTWWKNLGVDDAGLQRCRKGVCAAALLVSLAAGSGLAAAGETINYDGADASKLKIDPLGSGQQILCPVFFTDNIVNVTGTTPNTPYHVYGSQVLSNTDAQAVTGNRVTFSGGSIAGDVRGGYSSFTGTVTDNHVTITGGSMRNVYGGYAYNADASYNTATIGNVTGTVFGIYGGYSHYRNVTGNEVTINVGTTAEYVWGGCAYNAGTGTASDNKVNINGGTVNIAVYGGESQNGAASGNTVNISGGTVKAVFGGNSNSSTATNNTVTISGGAVSQDVQGGYTNTGAATGNTVTISGSGTVGRDVYGGFAFNGTTGGNTVNISGGQVVGTVYGGAGTTATGNTVNISGGQVAGTVYGGGGGNVTGNTVNISGGTFGNTIFAGGGTTVTGNTVNISGSPDLTNATILGHNDMNVAVWSTAGNILNVKSSGMRAKDVANFQYYNFYLPAAVTPGSTMLAVTNAADLTGTTIGVGLVGAPTVLRQGDQVTLINAPAGLTAPGINGTIAVKPVSIARADVFTLTTDANNLYATATSLQAGGGSNPPGGGSNPPGGDPNPPSGGLNPQAKALLEGRMAAIANISQGADLLAAQGMASARSTLVTGNAPAGFFAMSGSHNQYQTGSHIDVNGFSLIAGVGKKNATASGTMLNGLFLEYGRGNYSTYNSFVNLPSARGGGDTRYFGGGYLARSQDGSGQYLEGSVRAGRASTNFHSGDLSAAIGQNVAYDISSPYYGLHLAFGKEKEVGQNRTLDTYVKGIWTHQNASSATVTGDPISFDAVNSNRWQLGMKLTHKVNEQTTVRSGLAYSYEFDGKARGTAYGMSIDAPSLKGSTGIVEVGVTLGSKNNKNHFFDLSLQGFAGKVKGIAGNVEVTWRF